MRFFKTMALLAALALVGPAFAQEKKDTKKGVTVPFELLKTGHMAVQVKVNGEGPFRLIFDTGAPITLINNKVAKKADLLKDVPKPLFSLFGTMGEVNIKSMDVGGQQVKDVGAIVMDHPTVEAISEALGPIEGIVGFPFFARFEMTLDYQKKTMTFVPNGYKPPNVMASMQQAIMGSLAGGGGPTMLSSSVQLGMTVAKGAGDVDDGVTVKKVLEGSAVAEAGLKEGDRLLTLDGRWTDTINDTYMAASEIKPGETVELKIKREGKEMKLKLKASAGF